jgi:hypothetical protein
VVVRCKEKPRFHVKGGTYIQANEGTVSDALAVGIQLPNCGASTLPSLCTQLTWVLPVSGTLELQATLRNTFGFAEHLQLAAEKGSKGSNEFSIGVSRPRCSGGCDVEGTAAGSNTFALHRTARKQLSASSHQGVLLDARLQIGTPGRAAAAVGCARQPAIS